MSFPLTSAITTFPNSMWKVYAEKMLVSFKEYWPAEIALMVMLDDETLASEVQKLLRPQDVIAINDNPAHKDFLKRNHDKEHDTDYRKQALRFSHKVFSLKAASDLWKQRPEGCRYLIWMDADVILTRKVTLDDIRRALPREGDAVAYLGRKDWQHSECGWLAFDLKNGGHELINNVHNEYTSDLVFTREQWHDSWIWDLHIKASGMRATNLTEGKPGMEIWPHSPMAAWSKHYKGMKAKQDLVMKDQGMLQSGGMMQPSISNPMLPRGTTNIKIQTKNSIPDEQIRLQILENQTQITRWITPCETTDEEIVVVSAGPQLIAEDLRVEVDQGKRIVAVKHAIEPLRAAGITPWACILLDPRPHLIKFVENPDTSVIWFVASQVDPKVVKKLLDHGCEVWGYHAAVGANEGPLTDRQAGAVVSGGSATATRGLFMLDRLGFRNFTLYGYDLCYPDKPDMHERDQLNQPVYFDYAITAGGPSYTAKKAFWTKAELIAQFEEINQIIQLKTDWNIKAVGHGMVPFIFRAKEVNDLRTKEKIYRITGGKRLPSYKEMLKGQWPNKKKLSAGWLKWPLPSRRKPNKASSF